VLKTCRARYVGDFLACVFIHSFIGLFCRKVTVNSLHVAIYVERDNALFEKLHALIVVCALLPMLICFQTSSSDVHIDLFS